MFDRLYQENWLEQVTTKKGQLNWSIASLCSELVAKMAKDIGMTIRKGILWYHSYLVWLLFGDSVPICSFIFLNVFLLLIISPAPVVFE